MIQQSIITGFYGAIASEISNRNSANNIITHFEDASKIINMVRTDNSIGLRIHDIFQVDSVINCSYNT